MSMTTFELRLRHNLKAMLESKRISASELSRVTGIAKQVISDWLAGSRPRHIDQVKTVAAYFGVSVDELCFEGNPETAQTLELDEGWTSGVYEVRFRRLRETDDS